MNTCNNIDDVLDKVYTREIKHKHLIIHLEN